MSQDYFYHKRNLQGKIDNNYKNKGHIINRFMNLYYIPYSQRQLSINGIDKRSIFRRVALLNIYYHRIDSFLDGNAWITTQSKMRSTILEEFCGYLFKDLPIITKMGLGFFNKKVYSGIAINQKGGIFPKTKDVDFCIGKAIGADFGGKRFNIIVPLIAIECKTWLDKTMFSEAQYTAQKLKQGAPNVKVYILSGYSGIDKDEVPSKGQTPIDQVFLIGDTRTNVNKNAIYGFFSEVSYDLKKATKQIEINNIGKLLPE